MKREILMIFLCTIIISLTGCFNNEDNDDNNIIDTDEVPFSYEIKIDMDIEEEYYFIPFRLSRLA